MGTKKGRNDLCPCGSGKKHKKCCLSKKSSNIIPFPLSPVIDLREDGSFNSPYVEPESPSLPDRRAMEGFMFGASTHDVDSKVAEAQSIMYDAWDTSDPEHRIELALDALAVSPDCADAYVLLAEELAESPAEAIKFYSDGVVAGEHMLGEEAFVEDVGHFWGLIETRPYMRARAGLASCLWHTGKCKEAIGHYQELLRLNPGDNQGVRYLLATCYLELNDDDALAALLQEHSDEDFAYWAYTDAILAFRQEGDTPTSRKILRSAFKTNVYVPNYLLGKKKLPRELPDYFSPGQESEAIEYACDNISPWKKTRGALKWLGTQLK